MKRFLLAIVLASNIVLTGNAQDVAKTNAVARTAKVTSDSTYFDRKEGVAIFSGNVHVDDEEYQMHANEAYLFMSSTNDLKRIVARGNVALTNGTKRAYGAKASYHRDTGLIVLYAPEGGVAEVRDELPEGARVVRGRKIRFWVNAEQVEVEGAEITAPTENASAVLPDVLNDQIYSVIKRKKTQNIVVFGRKSRKNKFF